MDKNGEDIDISGVYIYIGAISNYDLDEYIDQYINDNITIAGLTCD